MPEPPHEGNPSTHGWCRAEDKMSQKLAAPAPFIGFFDDGRGIRRTPEPAKTKSCTHTGVTVE